MHANDILGLTAFSAMDRVVSDPTVSSVGLAALIATCCLIHGGDEESLRRLNIQLIGSADCYIGLTNMDNKIGLVIENFGKNNVVVVNNDRAGTEAFFNVKFLSDDCLFVVADLEGDISIVPIACMRADQQWIFWGSRSTAVGASIELAGRGSGVALGDDCMLSSGIWLRNHDMHTIFDVQGASIINQPPCSIILEQHIWVGQDTLLLGAERTGYGSVVGAKSLLRKSLPPMVVAAGVPAKILRTGASWSRKERTVDAETMALLANLQAIERPAAS